MKLVVEGDTLEVAVREGRCLKPPQGCGQPILLDRRKKTYDWPHESHKKQWLVTGLCPACQDQATLIEDGETVVRGLD